MKKLTLTHHILLRLFVHLPQKGQYRLCTQAHEWSVASLPSWILYSVCAPGPLC